MAAFTTSGLKTQKIMQISTVLRVFIIQSAAVYAELYFLYFIFLTEFSAAASCAAPASARLAVENSLVIFTLLVFNLIQCYFPVKDAPGAETSPVIPPTLSVCVGTGDVVLRYERRDSLILFIVVIPQHTL